MLKIPCKICNIFDIEKNLNDIFPKIIEEISSIWKEEIGNKCYSKITIGDKTFMSDNFIETSITASVPIELDKKVVGELEILDPNYKNSDIEKELIDTISLKISIGLRRIKLRTDYEESDSISTGLVNQPYGVLMIVNPVEEHKIKLINETGAKIFNKKVKDIEGEPFYSFVKSFINGKVADKWKKKIKEVVKYNVFRWSEDQIKTLGDRWFRSDFSTIILNSKNPDKDKQILVVIRSYDVTAEKIAKQKREIAEARYDSLYNNTLSMIHSIDENGNIVNASNYWLEVMGYDRDEVIGHHLTKFLSKQSAAYAKNVSLPKFFKD